MKKTLKTLMLITVMTVLCMAMAVMANAAVYSGECGAQGDNLTWTIDTDTATLYIDGTGDMEDYYYDSMAYDSDAPWLNYAPYVHYITFGPGVESIGEYAFYDCTNEVVINIPATVKNVRGIAFNENSTVVVDENNPYFTIDKYGVMFSVDGTVMKGITKFIGSYYYVPEGVTEITAYALEKVRATYSGYLSSYSSNKLILSSTVKDLPTKEQVVFPYIEVSENNPYYSSDRGALYNKDRTSVIAAPVFYMHEDYIIPETITEISDYAFYNSLSDNCGFLIPENVKRIGDYAFGGMSAGTKRISVSKGVEYLGDNCFEGTYTVYFEGTENEWKQISGSSSCGAENIEYEHVHVWRENYSNNPCIAFEECRVCGCVDAIYDNHSWYEGEGSYNCIEGGLRVYYCSDCSETKTETVAPAGSHNWYREETEDYYDCTKGGTVEYACYNCDAERFETIAPKASHEYSLDDYDIDVSEFCGKRYFFVNCKNCDVSDYEIPVTGTAEHDWEYWGKEITNCEDGGYKEYYCDSCEESKTVTVEPGSHTISEWRSNLDATCTEDGTKTAYCDVCEDGYFGIETVTDVGSALGHDYNTKWTVLTTATCTYPGISVRACKRCADIESQTTPAYGHFDNDEDGKCDECKVIIEIYAPNDPSIPADPPVYPGDPDDSHTEHTFGNWTEKDGIWYRVCSVCGYVESKVETEQGDVEIEYPQQPDCDFETEVIKGDEFILIEVDVKENLGENIEVLKAFDITLKNSDGVHVQPDGTVKVKLPLDWDKDGNYKVYRVNDDGTYTDMEAFRQGSHMVFDTDHFSIYIITEEVEKTETPDTPDEDPTENCSCNCHKKGFMAFIWKILNFFYKLFKMNPVCKCGIAHY